MPLKLDLKTALKYSILFLAGLGILYLAFKGQDLTKIWQEIKSANFFWIFVSAFAVWIAHVLRAARWQMLFHSMQYKVSLSNTYHAVMIGYLANMALPRFGEIGKCTIIHKTHQVPMLSSIGTVITERLFDILSLLISTLLLVIFQYDIISNFFINEMYQSLVNKVENLNYYWLAAISIVTTLSCIILIYLLRKKFSTKILKMFVSLRQGFSSYYILKRKGLFLLYTLIIWLFYFISMYSCFFALEQTATLSVNAAFTAIVFSGFAMAAPVQGGIGVFHWMIAKALMLYAVSFKDGLAYATIIHSSQALLILILGSFSLLIILYKQKNI